MKFAILVILIFAHSLNAAEFLNLMEQDFNRRPELLRFLPALENTVQILSPLDTRKPTTYQYGSIPEVEQPPGNYHPLCSGSIIGKVYFATASHCYWRMGLDRTNEWVLRKHRYEIQEGRLVRIGYEDFHVNPRVITQNQDTVIMLLNNTKVDHSFNFNTNNIPIEVSDTVHILGFPNDYYGVPFLSYNCRRISSAQNTFDTDCRLEGGMSGGPQFLGDLRTQISVNSSSQENPVGTFKTMSYFIEIPLKRVD